MGAKNKVGKVEWMRVSSQFCPVTSPMRELEKNIQLAKKNGEVFEAKYLEGVRYTRVIIGAATGLPGLA